MSQPFADRQVSGDSLLAGRLFDVEQRSWRPPRPVLVRDVGAYAGETGPVVFSEAGSPQLAASLVHDHTLLVLSESRASSIPAAGAWTVQWLPGQHAVVLLAQYSLARMTLHPLPVAPARVSWAPYASRQPEDYEETCSPSAGAAPEGGVFWVVQLDERWRHFRVMAYSAAAAACLGSWCCAAAYPVTQYSHHVPEAVRVSRQALAICCREATFVFAREGRFGTSAQPLFQTDSVVEGEFSADGRWFAGGGSLFGHGKGDSVVRVLDARTGSTVASLRPAEALRSSFEVSLHKVFWNSCNPCQLLAKCRLKALGQVDKDKKKRENESVVFSILQV